MAHDLLMASSLLLNGLTLATVVTLAFKWGRWSGVVDTRLDHIEQSLDKGGT